MKRGGNLFLGYQLYPLWPLAPRCSCCAGVMLVAGCMASAKVKVPEPLQRGASCPGAAASPASPGPPASEARQRGDQLSPLLGLRKACLEGHRATALL